MKRILKYLLFAGLFMANAAFADYYFEDDWSTKPGQTITIPISFKGKQNKHFIAGIKVKNDYPIDFYDWDSPPPTYASISVKWNGKVVPGGEKVYPGESVMFTIEDNGKMTIENLDTENGSTAVGNYVIESLAN